MDQEYISPQKSCRSCNFLLTEDQKYCPMCGEEYQQRICNCCHTQLNDFDDFCPSCGAQYIAPAEKCEACGADIAVNGKFCSVCGTETVAAKKKRKKSFVSSVVKRSLIFALSILLIVSCFIPMVHIELDEGFIEEGQKAVLDISPLDGVVLFTDSLYRLSDSDLSQAEIFKDAMHDLDNYDPYDRTGESPTLSSIIKNLFRVGLRSKNTVAPPSLAATAVLSLAYMVLCVILFFFALVSFIGAFTGMKKKAYNASVRLIALIPMIGLTAFISFKMAYSKDTSFSIATLVFFAIIAVALIGFAIHRKFFEEKTKVKPSHVVMRTFSLVFAVALIVFTFFPVLATTAKAKFGKSVDPRTATCYYDASVFNSMQATKDQLKDIKSAKETELFDAFSNYSKKAFQRGEVIENDELLQLVTIGYGANKISLVFTLATVVAIGMSLCAAFFVWKNIVGMVLGTPKSNYGMIAARILVVATAAYVLGIAIFVSVIASKNANIADIKYTVSFAYGAIVMVALAIGAASTPLPRIKNVCATQPIEPKESIPAEVSETVVEATEFTTIEEPAALEEVETVEISEVAEESETAEKPEGAEEAETDEEPEGAEEAEANESELIEESQTSLLEE